MKITFENVFYEAEIFWSKPASYDSVLAAATEYDELANLYMITARFAKCSSKMLYIGKTWKQGVHKRIGQKDHKKRIASYRGKHPHHKFEIRHGILTMIEANLTEKRLKDIENLLIYVSENYNIKSVVNHGVTKSYKIINKGSRCWLPKKIAFGLFSAGH
jgi:predicted GIY-YIG superfamily endonuclease